MEISPIQGRFTNNSCKRNNKLKAGLNWEYRRSDGKMVELNEQTIIHFSMEVGMRIMS
jgi:hypothetical protein